MNLSTKKQKKKKKKRIYIHYVHCEARKTQALLLSTYEWKQTDFKDLDFIVADDGGNTNNICGLL